MRSFLCLFVECYMHTVKYFLLVVLVLRVGDGALLGRALHAVAAPAHQHVHHVHRVVDGPLQHEPARGDVIMLLCWDTRLHTKVLRISISIHSRLMKQRREHPVSEWTSN